MSEPKVFFTADTHAFHKSIMKFCPETRHAKRFNMDADLMTEYMKERWNSQVRPKDIVYHVGDVSFGNPHKTKTWLDQLNGTIHLIKGNHDGRNMLNVIGDRFESISDYKYLRLNGNKFVLFHYPIHEWNSCHHGSIHLYGHVHDRLHTMEGKAMNVGIDTTPDFNLYSEEFILKFMQNRPIKEHHDCK